MPTRAPTLSRTGRRRLAATCAGTALTAGFLLAVPGIAQASTVTVGDCDHLITALHDAANSDEVNLGNNIDCDGKSPAVKHGTAKHPVTLDLAGYSLTIKNVPENHAGLGVPEDTALTIKDSGNGNGTLTTIGGMYGAGIGGDDGGDSGRISITGGTINAIGGYEAAGIGGGNGFAGIGGNSGDITISGGTITATGGFGAGIGGGYEGNGGDVAIDIDADVTATTSKDAYSPAPAIGAGVDGGTFGTLKNAGTLTIPAGAYLDIPSGVTVNNTGTLNNQGTLKGSGDVNNTGTIVNDGTIADTLHGNANGLKITGNSYKLTFDVNGGTGGPTDQLYVYADTTTHAGVALPAGPTPPGDEPFAGWQTDDGTALTDSTDLNALFGDGPASEELTATYSAPQPPTNPPSGSCAQAAGSVSSLASLFCGSL